MDDPAGEPFSGFALVLALRLLAAHCMQRASISAQNFTAATVWAPHILLAGVWVLTDSKILLLVSQKAVWWG